MDNKQQEVPISQKSTNDLKKIYSDDKSFIIFMAVLTVLGAIAVLVFFLLPSLQDKMWAFVAMVLGVMVGGLGFCGFLSGIYGRRQVKKELLNRNAFEE